MIREFLNEWVPVWVPFILAIIAFFGFASVWDIRDKGTLAVSRFSRSRSFVSTLPGSVVLVDRVRELRAVLDGASGPSRSVALVGPPGVGKSALAVAAARRLAYGRNEGRLKRHAIWLDARGSCPTLGDLARHVALLLDKPEVSTADLDRQETMLRQVMGSSTIVLLVDNLGPPTTAEQERLVEFLEHIPPTCVLIVSWIGLAETGLHTVAVGELDQRSAAELLKQEAERRLGATRTPMTSEQSERVLKVVGNNPQAIKWFASSSVASVHSTDTLLERLKTEATLPVFKSLFRDNWADLDETERTVLSSLSILPRCPPSGFLADLLRLDPGEVQRRYDDFFKRGFFTSPQHQDERSNDAVALSTMSRNYIRASMSRAEERSIFGTLVDSYAQMLEADWEGASAATPHIEGILAVMHGAKATGDCEGFLRLFHAIYDILFTLGLFEDRIRLGELAADCAEELGHPRVQALAWSVVSSTLALRGDGDLAGESLDFGMSAARQGGHSADIGYQRRCASYRQYRLGYVSEAAKTLTGALSLADQGQDPLGAVDIVCLSSAIALHRGELETAEYLATEAHRRILEIPWERGEAYPLRELAEVALLRGDIDAARQYAKRAHGIAVAFSDVRQQSRTLLTLARVDITSGDLRAARRTLLDAASTARRTGLPNELTECLAHLPMTRLTRRLLLAIRYESSRVVLPSNLSGMPIGGD